MGEYGAGILGTSLTSLATTANQQALHAYLNYQNTAGLGAFQIQYAPNYTITSTTTETSTETSASQKSAPRWKHATRAIDRLRGEISDWHGDILMRKAYA